jgi:beta-lactamase regulating signal transducer with metallopeptidase domain
MTAILNSSYVHALAWTLLHFLWQGAALGLIAFVWLRRTHQPPPVRYTVGVGILAAMLAAPVITYAWLMNSPDVSRSVTPALSARVASIAFVPAEVIGQPGASASTGSAAVVMVLGLWLSGVSVLSLRLLGGWIVARRFVRRAIRPVSPEIRTLAQRIAGRLALDRVVHVVESTAVTVPMIIGWLKPVVLLPAAALAGLSAMQVEALLAHELAHVRRHDYLVNLLQHVTETLLFYHPAVWWLSRQVRTEREHCCDDLAVDACGDRLVYATALSDLAALGATRGLALAATDGSLLERVQRILGQSGDRRSPTSGWISVVLVCLLAAALIPVVAARGRSQGSEAGSANALAADPAVTPASSEVPAVIERVAGAATADEVEDLPALPVQEPVPVDIARIKKQLSEIEEMRRALLQQYLEKYSDQMGERNRELELKAKLLEELKAKLAAEQRGSSEISAGPSEAVLAEIKARAEELSRAAEQEKLMGDERARAERQSAEAALDEAKMRAMENKRAEEELRVEQKMQALQEQAELKELNAAQLADSNQTADNLKEKLDQANARLQELKRSLEAKLAGAADQNAALSERAKLASERETGSGASGAVVFERDGTKITLKWTGRFRLSEDNRDIAWVEAGRTVALVDGSTVVEVRGLPDGRIERTYARNGQALPYEPSGREFVSTILQQVFPNGVRFESESSRSDELKAILKAVRRSAGRQEGAY